MKRIVTIGPIYGQDRWQDIEDLGAMLLSSSETPQWDYYIFMGNYIKSYDKTDLELKTMVDELITLKTNYPNNIILLIGRDDLQYIYPENHEFRIEGFQKNYIYFKELYESLSPYLVSLFQYGNNIWTNQGIFLEWASKFGITEGDGAFEVATLLLASVTDSGANSYVFSTGIESSGDAYPPGPIFGYGGKYYKDLVWWFNQIITDDHNMVAKTGKMRVPYVSIVTQLVDYKMTDFYEAELVNSVLKGTYN